MPFTEVAWIIAGVGVCRLFFLPRTAAAAGGGSGSSCTNRTGTRCHSNRTSGTTSSINRRTNIDPFAILPPHKEVCTTTRGIIKEHGVHHGRFVPPGRVDIIIRTSRIVLPQGGIGMPFSIGMTTIILMQRGYLPG